jgi:glycerate dehydrogenase
MNPGDLSWEPLLELGQSTLYDWTEEEAVADRLAGVELAITNKVVFPRSVLETLPQLRYLGITSTGTNVVDLEAASERGIVVTNVPSYSTASVAQMVFAHILHFTQGVATHSRAVAAGRWSSDWTFTETPQLELVGMTLGILGFGQIGRATAQLADAFGMPVLVHTRSAKALPSYARAVDLETLFRDSDVLSLHCPLTPETEGIVSAQRLALMKPTALLVNTSRGPLIDEGALAQALREKRLAGAGLDVLSVEPPPADHPLIGLCTLTPHLAWATRSARRRLLEVVTQNVAAYLAGTPQNVVSQTA